MDRCVDMSKTVPLHRLLVMLIVACYLVCMVSVALVYYAIANFEIFTLHLPRMQVDLIIPPWSYLTCYDQ